MVLPRFYMLAVSSVPREVHSTIRRLSSDLVKLTPLCSNGFEMFAKFVQAIMPNVSPLLGNTIENEERVSFGVVDTTEVRGDLEAIEWSDSIIERCRFHNSTISDSSFERVVIRESDLSGVTFRNCLLRDFLIMGIKARSYVGLDNCILDRVTIVRSHTDRFEIHNSRISQIDFSGVSSTQLTFHQCKPHKREGQVSFSGCSIEHVGGLETMGKLGVSTLVDEQMWRDLGDHYLREHGFQQLDDEAALHEGLLDEVAQGLDRRRLI